MHAAVETALEQTPDQRLADPLPGELDMPGLQVRTNNSRGAQTIGPLALLRQRSSGHYRVRFLSVHGGAHGHQTP